MINLEELLTERELYVYRNYPQKTYKVLGQELGVGTSRVGQIRNSALRKIREEKRRYIAVPWYQEEVTVTLKRGDIFLLEKAIDVYAKNVENNIWQYRNDDTDPEWEQCQNLIDKLQEAMDFSTHPINTDYDSYLNPDISDVK